MGGVLDFNWPSQGRLQTAVDPMNWGSKAAFRIEGLCLHPAKHMFCLRFLGLSLAWLNIASIGFQGAQLEQLKFYEF